MNIDEILKEIQSSDDNKNTYKDFVRHDYDHTEPVSIGKLKLKMVEYKGGCEGGGEHIYGVFQVNDAEYYRVEGNYDSWAGTEWSFYDLTPVKPVEKTITVYEVK